MPSLVLFDIDGTLVRKAGPQHRLALIEAIRLVTGVETTTDGIPVHGMLDPDIITLMMRSACLADNVIEGHLPKIFEAAQDIYDATVPKDLTKAVCPGVSTLLPKLHDAGVALALVTGNLTRIGWRKIERAGIRSYFRFADHLYLAYLGQGGHTRLGSERFQFDLYSSGEYSRMLERSWE